MIPSESQLLTAGQALSPLTSKGGNPSQPGGGRAPPQLSKLRDFTLAEVRAADCSRAGAGQDSCLRLAADPRPKRASLCKYEAAAERRTRPAENMLSLSRCLILSKLGNVFLAPSCSLPGALTQQLCVARQRSEFPGH